MPLLIDKTSPKAASALLYRAVMAAGLIAAYVFSSTGFLQAAGVSYKLGPQDKLRVYVYEWPALTGEFTVGANGTVALPLLGEISATGLQPSELAASISKTLQSKASLTGKPETSVDVTQYRPFYILGGVERPGEYSYRPGMTVLTAVSIAGGLHRKSDWSYERDFITSEGELRVLSVRRHELLAKQARLKAEAEDAKAVNFSPDPSKPNTAALPEAVIAQEQAIFTARFEKFEGEVQSAQRTIALFQNEIQSLEAQIGPQQRVFKAVEKELRDVRALVEKGLAPSPRLLPLEQSLAQNEREQREVETTIIRARQQINIAEQSITKLRDERRNGALSELQVGDAQLKEVSQRLDTARRIVTSAPDSSSRTPDGDEHAVLTYVVVRASDGALRETNVDELAFLEPGDVLKVRVSTKEPAENERRSRLSLGSWRGPSDGETSNATP